MTVNEALTFLHNLDACVTRVGPDACRLEATLLRPDQLRDAIETLRRALLENSPNQS